MQGDVREMKIIVLSVFVILIIINTVAAQPVKDLDRVFILQWVGLAIYFIITLMLLRVSRKLASDLRAGIVLIAAGLLAVTISFEINVLLGTVYHLEQNGLLILGAVFVFFGAHKMLNAINMCLQELHVEKQVKKQIRRKGKR